jgi:hypothetical protein
MEQGEIEAMLKHTALPLLTAILLASFCHAHQSSVEDQHTKGLLNGRFWNDFGNYQAKLFFVLGYCEGATGAASFLRCPKQLEFGEIVKGIDKFYQEPENLRLPFIVSIQILRMKVEGAKATEIDAAISKAKEQADQPDLTPVPRPPLDE